MTGISSYTCREEFEQTDLTSITTDVGSTSTSLLTLELRESMTTLLDKPLACDLYRWSSDLGLIYHYLLPLVRIVARKTIRAVADELEEEVMADAAANLYIQLARRTYDSDEWDPDHFINHYYAIVRRHIIEAFRDVVIILPEKYEQPQPPRMLHPYDVENHLYLLQIPDVIRQHASNRIRFSGAEKDACLYLIDRILTGTRIVLPYLTNELHLREPEFYVTYIVVILRATIYDLKLEGYHFTGHAVLFGHDGYSSSDRDQDSGSAGS